MSDDDDDLFASDSDDTAELLEKSKATTQVKDSSGLFDSSDDEDEGKKKESPPTKKKKKALSKRDRLEALAKKKHKETSGSSRKGDDDDDQKKKGYESEDSYESVDFQRTAEDDAFLDTTGEDADAVQELYAEQNFGRDVRDPEDRKKKRRRRADDEAMEDNGEPDNPIMAAVHRMKKKKRAKKSFSELEDECREFLGRMEMAADEDDEAIRFRTPATSKLKILNEVVDVLTMKDRTRMLLDLGLLSQVKRWIQPLSTGKLGNVTVRQRVLSCLAQMTGESGINGNDLKRSELGKTVMILARHKDETPALKREIKSLIEQWSRPIFQKSGNMRDLERVHHMRGGAGLAGLAAQQMADKAAATAASNSRKNQRGQDLGSVIASGKIGGAESGINRVRVPFSKGFAYSVRPDAKSTGATDDKRVTATGKDIRGKLSKRMLDKSRPKGKNQRSANISIEGRKTKG